jgi:hypothetical protein
MFLKEVYVHVAEVYFHVASLNKIVSGNRSQET